MASKANVSVRIAAPKPSKQFHNAMAPKVKLNSGLGQKYTPSPILSSTKGINPLGLNPAVGTFGQK